MQPGDNDDDDINILSKITMREYFNLEVELYQALTFTTDEDQYGSIRAYALAIGADWLKHEPAAHLAQLTMWSIWHTHAGRGVFINTWAHYEQ